MWTIKLRLKNITHKSANTNDEASQMKQRVNEILDKLNDSGWDSLTDQDESYLTKASKRLYSDRPPN